jgi:lipopolysaccharide transport system ATP-binding protein
MKPSIKVEGVGKQYRIGESVAPYSTARDAIMRVARAPLARLRRKSKEDRTIWALKDINFEVYPGEVIGVIGRNGAGKSTLLKILSRITEPTVGCVELYGRVGSLLEVGTGFHPELSGRDNIYLNGAILGMRRVEIEDKFDEIVAFAEIEKFLDTPVKHYSSGMYTRLAFAVAAHLEPEILVVDEVLAVGDSAFQAKCLGKMESVAKEEGRTVLFVSHNLGSVANLCSRSILLVEGSKYNDGPSAEVINQYIALGREVRGEVVWQNPQDAPGNENVRLHAVRIISGGEVTDNVDIQEPVQVEMVFWNLKPGARICASLHLLDKTGTGVLASINTDSANLVKDEWFGRPHPVSLYRTVCTLPGNFLNEGRYSINAMIMTDISKVEAFVKEAVSFYVYETGGMRAEYGGPWLGVVRPRLEWKTERLGASEKEAVRREVV